MIGKCCGIKLERVTTDAEGFRKKVHRWKCSSCGQNYTQRLRKAVPKDDKSIVARR